MSENTYKGLTAEQWHNAYQDLKRKYNRLDESYDCLFKLWINRVVSQGMELAKFPTHTKFDDV